MRVAVVASAQIFGGFQNLPPLQSLDFPAFFGLSHLFPPRPSISVIFDTDLVTSHQRSKRVRLTEKGEQLARTCADRVAEAEARAIGSMSPDDRAALIRLTELYGTLLGEQLQTNQ